MKLKREANSFQKKNSDTATKVKDAHTISIKTPVTMRKERVQLAGQSTVTKAMSGSHHTPAARSNTTPMANIGITRYGINKLKSPLKMSKPKRTSALSAM